MSPHSSTLLLLAALLAPGSLAAQAPDATPPQHLTPNTLAFDSAAPRVAATVDDVAWVGGLWRSDVFGGVGEEWWSAPEAGSIMGVFRLMRDDAVVFYEIMSIQEDGESLAMVLKHFHGDLRGWEERDEVQRFPLVRIEPGVAWFEGMTYRRVGDDEIVVDLAVEREDGPPREVRFRYTRVRLEQPD